MLSVCIWNARVADHPNESETAGVDHHKRWTSYCKIHNLFGTEMRDSFLTAWEMFWFQKQFIDLFKYEMENILLLPHNLTNILGS